VRFVIHFDIVDAFGAAEGLPRRDVLGAPTTWWGSPIAADTETG
jgi:hypothetical protein